MILAAAAASSGTVSIPLSALITILSFGLAAATSFAVWLVKQISTLSKFQAETLVVLQNMADRSKEDRVRIEALERHQFSAPPPRRTHTGDNP